MISNFIAAADIYIMILCSLVSSDPQSLLINA